MTYLPAVAEDKHSTFLGNGKSASSTDCYPSLLHLIYLSLSLFFMLDTVFFMRVTSISIYNI